MAAGWRKALEQQDARFFETIKRDSYKSFVREQRAQHATCERF
jgi:hypothetical protein